MHFPIGQHRAIWPVMTEREFKKHLRDMVHGMHHPEEHDWGPEKGRVTPGRRAKSSTRAKTKRRSK
jgi:hypothetical protein